MKKAPHEQHGRSCTEHSTLLSSTMSPMRWHHIIEERHTTIRQDIWTVLRFRSSVQHRSGLQYASYILELSVLTLILLNVIVAISETSAVVDGEATGSFSGPNPVVNDWTDIFLLVSTIIFSIEYVLRLWSCVEDERYNKGVIKGRLKWMSRPLSLIDLMALIPFYLEVSMEYNAHHNRGLTLRSLRLLRIVSFLRLERMYNAMKNLRTIFMRKKEEFLVLTYLTALMVLTSSLLIFFLEHLAQPSVFSSFSVSLWWSVETITSLGYGDIVPVTSMGRLVGASLALWGIVLFAIPGAVLGSSFIEVMLEKQREEEAELYSMAVSVGDRSRDGSLFVGSFSDDEQSRDYDHPAFACTTPTSAALTPVVQSADNPSTPRIPTGLALHQRFEAITTGQHRLEMQLKQQQEQLEQLTRLVQAALGSASSCTKGASTCHVFKVVILQDPPDQTHSSQPSSVVTRTSQTRGFVNMLGSATKMMEKAADQAAEPVEHRDIVLDGFAKRQFDDKTYSGTHIDYNKEEFVKRVNEIYEANSKKMVDGYAPFCKHLFIKNFAGARLNMVPITRANSSMLMSDYEARTEYELPVLTRWFPSHSVTPMVAEYLDIILYSREQIIKENEAVEVPADPLHTNSPWGIVAIKAQNEDYELPMKPITMMRNAIGKTQGGSGVPINRDEYMKAVEYWKNHAVIKKM
ncbi:unnamed protein product [Peronospora belbahrii]|uniref:Ion transport domain-containing protein n=1 Tax=Peronospora belbahrii TaxID=622444 RepID=A0ABN8CW97_9STRA|nr:unnamed protein product [Peronospora belbahrii]